MFSLLGKKGYKPPLRMIQTGRGAPYRPIVVLLITSKGSGLRSIIGKDDGLLSYSEFFKIPAIHS